MNRQPFKTNCKCEPTPLQDELQKLAGFLSARAGKLLRRPSRTSCKTWPGLFPRWAAQCGRASFQDGVSPGHAATMRGLLSRAGRKIWPVSLPFGLRISTGVFPGRAASIWPAPLQHGLRDFVVSCPAWAAKCGRASFQDGLQICSGFSPTRVHHRAQAPCLDGLPKLAGIPSGWAAKPDCLRGHLSSFSSPAVEKPGLSSRCLRVGCDHGSHRRVDQGFALSWA